MAQVSRWRSPPAMLRQVLLLLLVAAGFQEGDGARRRRWG